MTGDRGGSPVPSPPVVPGPLGPPRRVPPEATGGHVTPWSPAPEPDGASAAGWGAPASRDWRPDPAWSPEPAWEDRPPAADRGWDDRAWGDEGWDDDATRSDAPPAAWGDPDGRGDRTMAHTLAPTAPPGRRPYEEGPDAPPDWRPTPPGGQAAAAGHRHRPGLGAVLGVAGLVVLVLALMVLPWFSSGGRDATFADIRDVVADPDRSWAAPASPALAPIVASSTAGPASASTPAAPAQETGPEATATTAGPTTPADPAAPATTAPAAPGTSGPGAEAPPTPSTLVPPAEVPLGDAPAEATPVDDRREDYLERFADWGWMAVVGLAAVAVAFSTLVVPRGRRGRVVTGFLQAGPLGAAVNAVDRGGRVGPRAVGALVTLVAGAGYVGALDAVFGGDRAPSPAFGAWAGLVGLVAVFAGCLVGVRRRPDAAAGVAGP